MTSRRPVPGPFRSSPSSPFGELPPEAAPAARRQLPATGAIALPAVTAAAAASGPPSKQAPPPPPPPPPASQTPPPTPTPSPELPAPPTPDERDTAPTPRLDDAATQPIERRRREREPARSPGDAPGSARTAPLAAVVSTAMRPASPPPPPPPGPDRAVASASATATGAAAAAVAASVAAPASPRHVEDGAPRPVRAGGPPVRGRRFPELVADGDGYTLPALGRRFETAFREEAPPSDPVILMPPPGVAPAAAPGPQRWGVRALMLLVVGVAAAGLLSLLPTVGPLAFVFAVPPMAAAIVLAAIGALGGDARRAPAATLGLLAVLLLAADLLLLLARFR